MSSKSRLLIFLVSTPLVILVGVGGLLGASTAPQTGFPVLRVFQRVVGLIRSDYVEEVDIDRVMEGAMRGLADGLDPSSAYLTPDEVQAVEANAALPAGDVGLVLTRQYYLRVVGVRDLSPAARAGLRTGDLVRAIDGKSTRDLSAFTGTRLLRGAPGSRVSLTVIRLNAVDPRVIELVREVRKGSLVTGRRLPGGEAYIRVSSFADGAAHAVRTEVDALPPASAGVIIDLRGVADGPIDEGIAAARHFVKAGTLAILASRTDKKPIASAPGDGAAAMPVVLLVSNGTAGAAEVFAAALSGNHRAELVGEPTPGVAGLQHLVKLPDGRGLWMTYARYLTTGGESIHEHGLVPDVVVQEPAVDFDEPAPTTDPALAKAVERLKAKK